MHKRGDYYFQKVSMTRYIDADAFSEKMKRQYCENCDNYQGIRCRSCSCGDWLDDLYFEPTADAVEVVRCKDCLHGSWSEGILRCNIMDEPMTENDFCSKGDRI